jgi:hypothetical protein
LVADKNYEQFKQNANSAKSGLDEWFDTKRLILNLTKTNPVKFTLTNLVHVPLTIEYKNILVDEIVNTQFLGMCIDKFMNKKRHIELILPTLSATCYAKRRLYYTLKSNTVHMVYFAYFHSMINYGLIYRGNLTSIHKVFKLHKKCM